MSCCGRSWAWDLGSRSRQLAWPPDGRSAIWTTVARPLRCASNTSSSYTCKSTVNITHYRVLLAIDRTWVELYSNMWFTTWYVYFILYNGIITLIIHMNRLFSKSVFSYLEQNKISKRQSQERSLFKPVFEALRSGITNRPAGPATRAGPSMLRVPTK